MKVEQTCLPCKVIGRQRGEIVVSGQKNINSISDKLMTTMKKTVFFILILFSIQAFCQEKIFIVDVANRNNAIELTNLARKKFENKEYQNATDLVIKSIKTDSVFRQNYDLLYKSVVTSKNSSDSILNIFLRAKEIFEEDDEICYYTGEIYRMRDDLNAAVNEYTLAIHYSSIIPEKSFFFNYFYLNRASSYLKQKKYDLAEKDFSFVLSQDAVNTTALINRGICNYYLGKKDKAKNDWIEANKLGDATALSYLKKLK